MLCVNPMLYILYYMYNIYTRYKYIYIQYILYIYLDTCDYIGQKNVFFFCE